MDLLGWRKTSGDDFIQSITAVFGKCISESMQIRMLASEISGRCWQGAYRDIKWLDLLMKGII